MGDNGKKKRLAIIGGSAVLLVALVVAVAVGVSRHNSVGSPHSGGLSASVKAIQSICQPTDYRETCVSTLTAVAGNVTDPKELIAAAFKATADQITNGIEHSSVLQAAAKDPSTSDALKICKEVLDYAVDDLHSSLTQLGGLEIGQAVDKAVDDLMVWLSAVITYQETCLDGFENKTSDAAASMRKALTAARELTSNSLAIVDQISSVVKSFDLPSFSRKLLSEGDGFPSWVPSRGRKLLQLSPDQIAANVTVALDGTGNFRSINEALQAVPTKSNDTFVIYIKEGVYAEKVVVGRSTTNLMLVGDGPTKTRITGSLNFIDGVKTFGTATFTAIGNGFIAKSIGFENTAGPEKHQAVALLVQSDLAVFYNCQMDAYQDTLYVHSHRQFYRECTISGTIDFIFGDSASVFQNCLILVRKPLDNQQNIVTAQGRSERHQKSAIILHNCTISADPTYFPFRAQLPTYLGRPWKAFSRTFVLQCQLDDLINPQGWLPWDGDLFLRTLFYTEVDNRGLGADTTRRVTWRGVKKIDYGHAQRFTVEHFINGNDWLPATGVPYVPGLLPMSEPGRIH